MHIPKMGERWGASICSGPGSASNQRSRLSDDLPQHRPLTLYSNLLFYNLFRSGVSTQDSFAYVNRIVLKIILFK